MEMKAKQQLIKFHKNLCNIYAYKTEDVISFLKGLKFQLNDFNEKKKKGGRTKPI